MITPALISGAFAERMKFSAFACSRSRGPRSSTIRSRTGAWGPGGWLAQLGAIDFAGGTVVHLSSGISALVVALVLGKRRGYPHARHPPHDLTMTVLGAGLLWFGWFGFNAGSARNADGSAATRAGHTHLAAAAGALTWALSRAARISKVTMLGVASGLVAGLVAITPAAGYVSPMSAIAIGLAAGGVCYGGVLLKTRLGYDDALDAFGVHGIGGATRRAPDRRVRARRASTTATGGGWSLTRQAGDRGGGGLGRAWSRSSCSRSSRPQIGLRVDHETEYEGLDGALHGESGYAIGPESAGEAAREADEPARHPAGAPSPVGA